MRTTTRLTLLLLIPLFTAQAQYHPDFIGAGHDTNVKVMTSNSNDAEADGGTTVDGFEIDNSVQLSEASRFLAQASLGADIETIRMVAAMGYEAWLDEQFNLPTQSFLNSMDRIFIDHMLPNLEDNQFPSFYFRSAWFQHQLYSPDLLRQRLAMALSEILVISDQQDVFSFYGQVVGNYYDLLNERAFGTYKDLLYDVSLNAGMGFYLSHYNNPRAIPEENIHPDENYAREIMQLFSIGLYQLNQDGTRKKDGDNNDIPTYDNDDIKELAKVFTGLGDGAANGAFLRPPRDHIEETLLSPMRMYQFWHEPSEKVLLKDLVIPAFQPGLQDIDEAVTYLANHENVGPFIGKKLIQFLVTSNPNPAYVQRVSDVWSNNGAGVRGDLEAVVKAILLDPDARNCNANGEFGFGKLREPMVRLTNYLKAFNGLPRESTLFTIANRFHNATEQMIMSSPTVFNFFLPDFAPNGAILESYLVAPEFQIHNAQTAIGYVNEVNLWTMRNSILTQPFNPRDDRFSFDRGTTAMDFSTEEELVETPNLLVKHLNLLLANGNLSDDSESIISNAISEIPNPELQLDMALYLLMISPEYAIQK